MKRISYGGSGFVTGDLIADALLDYAASLANSERAVQVHVPSVDLDGNTIRTSVVLGPASQLIAEPIMSADELEDDEFVSWLRTEVTALRRASGVDVSPTTP